MSLRFDRFELRAFGPFTGTVLELQGSPGSLHLICGPNEVGKSTAQRAVGDFLFGIPPRTTDNQLHSYGDMRLGAVIVDADGARHELVRRKGARSTLLGPDGQPVDEGSLERMLGGLSRDAFEAMFSITHETLVVGGRALLAAGGEVGESLFSASLGASSLHQLREQLDSEAGHLFRPRATSSLILQARAQLDAAQSELRESTLRASSYVENEHQLNAAAEGRKNLAERLRLARADQNARRRLVTLIPLLSERERVQLELEDLRGVPSLPEDSAELRVRAVERAAHGRTSAGELQTRIEHLTQRLVAVGGHDPLLARELAIKDLHGRSSSVREATADLERQEAKLQLAADLARAGLDEIRPDLDLAQADVLGLDSRRRAGIDAALDERARLIALLEQADRAIGDADDRAGQLRLELAAHADPPDTTMLEATVTEAQADGQLERRLHDAEEELRITQDQLAAALHELQPRLNLDALQERPCPSLAAVQEFAAERDALADRRRKLGDRRDRLEAERRQLNDDRTRLMLTATVPTVEALTLARTERDNEWTSLRRRLDGDTSTVSSPDTFERHLHHADELGDALRDHADTAARATELDLRQRRLQADADDLEYQVEGLERRENAQEQRWTEAWTRTQIAPRTPQEMIEWLRQRQTALDRALTVTARQRTVNDLRKRREAHLAALTTALAKVDVPYADGPTLNALLSIAQARLATARTERADRLELDRDLRLAGTTAARQRETARESRQQLETWTTSWTMLVTGNAWPTDTAPEDARELLATIDKLALQLRDMTQLKARVSGIEDRIHAFRTDATALIEETAPELASWPAPDAVAELSRRLDDAVQHRSRRETLTSELELARDEAETVQHTIEQAEAAIMALTTIAGVQDIEDVQDVERRAARQRLLQSQLPAIEARITQAGQTPLREIIQRTAGVDLDALDAEVETAETELVQLEEELAQFDIRLGELRTERQSMERAGGAAAARQLVEQRRAELRELVERYLRVQIAAWALTEAVDDYRRDHKDPLLRRADELFPQLTCGSFNALEVGFDDADDPVLVGVRRNEERVPVERMSTGTREQLYLALRLASLERHVHLHGPMPVILDDVVLHSDPKRKAAILSALAELGRSTQVIAFSHDPQVVALAQSALAPELVTLHELGGHDITNALHPATGAADVHPIRRPEAA